MDKLIVPVHTPLHWSCGVVDINQKTFYYYDSLYSKSRKLKFVKVMKAYLGPKLNIKIFHGWKVAEDVGPQQSNGVDCGVFTIL